MHKKKKKKLAGQAFRCHLSAFVVVDVVVVVVGVAQAAEGHGVPLGPDAVGPDQHPDVGSGAALDARRLPALHAARAPACLRGAARGGRTPLRDVSGRTPTLAEGPRLSEKPRGRRKERGG